MSESATHGTASTEKRVLIELDAVQMVLSQKTILADIALKVEQNQIVTLIGPNGAGKTTLIKILLGLLEPTTGRVWHRPHLRMGYMPQRLQIDAFMPLSVRRFLKPFHKDKTHLGKQWIDRLAIGHLLDSPIQTISGGEFQRVLLARALLNNPEVLVLDEPVQGVDVIGQAELYSLIRDIRQQTACAVVLVSHDLHLVMAETDQVLCLNQHICCSGNPAHVTQHPEFIKLFGEHVASSLAIYSHHHNHRHQLDGEITND